MQLWILAYEYWSTCNSFLGLYWGVELLGRTVILCLIYWGTSDHAWIILHSYLQRVLLPLHPDAHQLFTSQSKASSIPSAVLCITYDFISKISASLLSFSLSAPWCRFCLPDGAEGLTELCTQEQGWSAVGLAPRLCFSATLSHQLYLTKSFHHVGVEPRFSSSNSMLCFSAGLYITSHCVWPTTPFCQVSFDPDSTFHLFILKFGVKAGDSQPSMNFERLRETVLGFPRFIIQWHFGVSLNPFKSTHLYFHPLPILPSCS